MKEAHRVSFGAGKMMTSFWPGALKSSANALTEVMEGAKAGDLGRALQRAKQEPRFQVDVKS